MKTEIIHGKYSYLIPNNDENIPNNTHDKHFPKTITKYFFEKKRKSCEYQTNIKSQLIDEFAMTEILHEAKLPFIVHIYLDESGEIDCNKQLFEKIGKTNFHVQDVRFYKITMNYYQLSLKEYLETLDDDKKEQIFREIYYDILDLIKNNILPYNRNDISNYVIKTELSPDIVTRYRQRVMFIDYGLFRKIINKNGRTDYQILKDYIIDSLLNTKLEPLIIKYNVNVKNVFSGILSLSDINEIDRIVSNYKYFHSRHLLIQSLSGVNNCYQISCKRIIQEYINNPKKIGKSKKSKIEYELFMNNMNNMHDLNRIINWRNSYEDINNNFKLIYDSMVNIITNDKNKDLVLYYKKSKPNIGYLRKDVKHESRYKTICTSNYIPLNNYKSIWINPDFENELGIFETNLKPKRNKYFILHEM